VPLDLEHTRRCKLAAMELTKDKITMIEERELEKT
jgi:hypothetical protein